MDNPSRNGGSTTSLGAGSFLMATYGDAPRISFAVWPTALVPSTALAAITASVLINALISVSSEAHRVDADGLDYSRCEWAPPATHLVRQPVTHTIGPSALRRTRRAHLVVYDRSLLRRTAASA